MCSATRKGNLNILAYTLENIHSATIKLDCYKIICMIASAKGYLEILEHYQEHFVIIVCYIGVLSS